MSQINQNIDQIFKSCRRIAVVGLSDKPWRASHGVAKLMQRGGYQIIPVNPALEEVLGEKCYPSLGDVPGEIDLVDIFRRAEYVDEIVDQAVEKGVKAVWMQLGIVNQKAAEKALKAGLQVVMDRCWAIEYGKLAT